MNEPDYELCGLEDLLDIESHIDKKSYPKRHARIMSILNDPIKREKLDREHSELMKIRERESAITRASFVALIIWVYGAIVLFFGTILLSSSAYQLTSIPLRIVVFLLCLAAGYSYLISALRKIENRYSGKKSP